MTPRFDDFRAMDSRRASVGCVNGETHAIEKGDQIGWSSRYRVACCAPCWATWCGENAEAQLYEDNSQGYGH